MAYNDFKTEILALALQAFRKRATLARFAWSDLSGAAGVSEQGDTLRITRVSHPGAPGNATMRNTPTALKTAATTKVDLVIDRWKEYHWDVSDKDNYDTGGRGFTQIAPTYGAALADYMERDLFLGLERGSGHLNGTVATALTAANSIAAVIGARQGLVSRDADTANMAAFVTPASAAILLATPAFTTADMAGQQGIFAGMTGALGTKYGFAFAESNNIPAIAKGHANNPNVNGAVSIGDQTITVDGAGAGGIDPGELLTNGGNTYAVVLGIGGTAGTITIDRPAVAAIADNQVLTRGDANTPNLGITPDALAVAMRPTAAPQSAGDVMSIVDPETGFSLTLEVARIVHGTRYYISALWGSRVTNAGSVQRFYGT